MQVDIRLESSKTKSSKEVTSAVLEIYKGKLHWPVKIRVDPGSEFKRKFKKEMYKHGTLAIEATSKGGVALVKRMNRTVAERILMAQYEKEL